jgi:hypothetical protein
MAVGYLSRRDDHSGLACGGRVRISTRSTAGGARRRANAGGHPPAVLTAQSRRRAAPEEHIIETSAMVGAAAVTRGPDLCCSSECVLRDRFGLPAGEEPSDDGRERGHAEEDEEEVGDGDVPEGRDPAVE